ncbi:MAG: hypothetical protein WBO45_24345 [Planctomycetota bacterium]
MTFFVVAVLISAAPGQVNWFSIPTTSSPPGRNLHAMAYDQGRQRVVLFGGTTPAFSDETWECDGALWVQRFPTSAPAIRHRHAMAYDAARQRVVMFGGINLVSWHLGDTWEWDGVNWVQRTTPGPSSRNSHAMAYDVARQQVVLFGGHDGNPLAGTFLWNGATWVQASSVTSPSPRAMHGMAYDAMRQRVVLFGGDNAVQLSDTWEWDGVNWTQMTPTLVPPARSMHPMAYDQLRQRVVMFGGYSNGIDLDDTWEWDGVNWQQFVPTTSPPARREHQMVYDTARQRLLMFGGAAPGIGLANDTWVFGYPAATVLASAVPYGSGCGNPPLTFAPDAAARPIIGQQAGATIGAAPTLAAGVAMGWSNTFAFPVTLPFDLGGIGMPGCSLLQSAQIIGLAATPSSPTSLSFTAGIPYVPGLLGVHTYLQAYAFAPGQNPLQAIISNGIDWTVGDY